MKNKNHVAVLLSMLLLALTVLGGCQKQETSLPSYKDHYEEVKSGYTVEGCDGMAEDLAVVSLADATDPAFSYNVKAAFTANEDTKEVLLSYHAFDKVYPASITKVMTALLTLENEILKTKSR
jgi:hypothetical protein